MTPSSRWPRPPIGGCCGAQERYDLTDEGIGEAGHQLDQIGLARCAGLFIQMAEMGFDGGLRNTQRFCDFGNTQCDTIPRTQPGSDVPWNAGASTLVSWTSPAAPISKLTIALPDR